MKRDSSSPKAYRNDVSGSQREILEAIRTVIFDVAPGIQEQIKYGMLDYPGLANLAAQKQYVALYVVPTVLAAHKAAFTGVNSGKSCLRFRKLGQADPQKLHALLSDVW